MKFFHALIIFLILLASSFEAQADLQEANDAYQKGAYALALEKFTKLATDGEIAQYSLGLMYINGQGVPQDYKTAISWFRKAAEQGNILAQYSLGLLYANGQGLPQDFKKAALCYYKAGVQGNASARYRLATLYANGQGVTQNE